MRFVILLLLAGLIATPTPAQEPTAQPVPEISATFSRDGVEPGGTLYVNVLIRNAAFVGGLEAGFELSECLQIIGEREMGDFIPGPGESGVFAMVQENEGRNSRLGLSLSDRSVLGNGDGLFFRVPIEATCEGGEGSVTLTHAEVYQIHDPEPQFVSGSTYTLNQGNLPISGATVQIAPGLGSDDVLIEAAAQDAGSEAEIVQGTLDAIQALEQATIAVAEAANATADAINARATEQAIAAAATPAPDDTADADDADDADTEAAPADDNLTLLIVAVVGIAVVLLVILLIVGSRSRGNSKQKR